MKPKSKIRRHHRTPLIIQIVDLLTASHGSGSADFKCFYCEDAVVGDIGELKAHFDAAHAAETFKVKSLAAANKASKGRGATTGYLECQGRYSALSRDSRERLSNFAILGANSIG